MQLSSRLAVAVHILLAIAYFRGREKTTSEFLAGSVCVNPVVIRNILRQLKAAGLVCVKAGIGGADLAADPRHVSLLDVYKAVEKERKLFPFHDNPNPDCPVGRHLHDVLDGKFEDARQAMEEKLAQTTLYDLLSKLKEY